MTKRWGPNCVSDLTLSKRAAAKRERAKSKLRVAAEVVEFSYQIMQGGILVVEVTAPTAETGFREIMHYAAMYAQEGTLTVREPVGQDTLRSFFSTENAP